MNDSNLKEFIAAVNAEVDNKIKKIRKQADKSRKEILEKTENEALNNAYSKIKSCVSEEKFKSKMAVSKAEQEARIKVLTHREELVEKIFSSVDEKLKEFTESEKYIGFLSDLLKDENTDSNSVVYLREEDLRYESELRKITGNDCSFEADKSIVYGGLSIYDRTTSVLNNKTIDNMLEEQKETFGSNYRLA